MQRCRASWEQKLTDYEWVLWDRQKVEEIENKWLKQTLESGHYAFATDFIRVYALYHFGGIYLDADVEVIGLFDPFLQHRFFIGLEYNGDLEPAVFGSVPGHPLLKELLGYYQERSFIQTNKQFDLRPLPLIFNEKASGFGFLPNGRAQSLKEGIRVYPCEYFSPKNLYFKKFKTFPQTVAIHYLESSWVTKGWKHKCKILFHQVLYLLGGKRLHTWVVDLIRGLQ